MRISDWSSDVCSSDLAGQLRRSVAFAVDRVLSPSRMTSMRTSLSIVLCGLASTPALAADLDLKLQIPQIDVVEYHRPRSEEHTSELQSLIRISYAVFCLKKKKTKIKTTQMHRKT